MKTANRNEVKFRFKFSGGIIWLCQVVPVLQS